MSDRPVLRLVKDDEGQQSPLDEIREGADVLARLTTNPLLSDHAQRALAAARRVLVRRLPGKS